MRGKPGPPSATGPLPTLACDRPPASPSKLQRAEVEILPGRVEGQVRPDQADREEERLVLFPVEELLRPADSFVVAHVLVADIERAPVEMGGHLQAVEWFLRRLGIRGNADIARPGVGV